MADCCAELRSELAALRAEVAKLGKVDEESIINRAVDRADKKLSPPINAASALAGESFATATAAATAIAVLNVVVTELSGGVAALRTLVAPLAPAIAGLVARVGALAAGLAAVTAQVAFVVATIAGVVASLALIYAMQTRLDALESYTDTINNTASTALSNALKAIGIGQQAQSTATTATHKADQALSNANNANGKADDALSQIPAVKAVATDAQILAKTANGKADDALSQIPAIKFKADSALSTANTSQTTAIQAIAITQEALQAKAIPGAPGRDGAPGKEGAPGKDAKLDPSILQRISKVESDIREQEKVNQQGLTLIQQLPTVLQPTIVNSVTKTVEAIVPKSIDEAVAEVEAAFKAVSDANAAALAPQFQKTIDANKAAIGALSGSLLRELNDIGTSVDTVVGSVATGAGTSTKKLEDMLVDVQGSLDYENSGTKRTLEELSKVTGLIGALPLAFVNNPAVQQAAVTAAVTANCKTAAPGGCTDEMNQRNNNNLSNILGGANAAANGLQLAALEGIKNTVNAVNGKLGSTVLKGGVSGALSGLINNTIVDRTLQLVSVAGILHNCMMLSNQIGETLFSMLDNIFAIPTLIKDPNGNTIDTKGAFTKYLDGIFANVFGVTEWQSIKSQWKAYSTIYNTGSQVFGNLRDIFDETGQIQTVTRNWVAELGNGLQDEGLIGENNWEPKDPTAQIKGKYFARLQRIADGLQQVENVAEDLEQVTQSARSIVETANEIKENAATINKAVTDANTAAAADRAAKEEGLELPNFSLGDLF